MDRKDTVKAEIVKIEKIVAESRENYEKNPESYSAKLLLLSSENHLSDLLKELDVLLSQGK